MDPTPKRPSGLVGSLRAGLNAGLLCGAVLGVVDGIVAAIEAQGSRESLLALAPDLAAVERAVEIAKEKGARRAMLLPVSAPFHCALMQPAADRMAEALSGTEIKAPVVPLVANVRAAMRENPGLKVYFARGDFKGLSGFYTSGVIEGGYHYGVFSDP